MTRVCWTVLFVATIIGWLGLCFAGPIINGDLTQILNTSRGMNAP